MAVQCNWKINGRNDKLLPEMMFGKEPVLFDLIKPGRRLFPFQEHNSIRTVKRKLKRETAKMVRQNFPAVR
jgi:hypothetical protein